MNRRGFLQACLASAIAPYVVTSAGVLMPLAKIQTISTMSEASLEAMIIEIMSFTNDRGLRINLLPKLMYLPNVQRAICGGGYFDKLALEADCRRILSGKRLAMCGFGYTTDER